MTSKAQPDTGAAPVDTEAAQRLQSVLERLVARKGVPHAVIGVARADGSFHWVDAAGPAQPDGTPMRPDTPFFVASVTKLYIATLVLQLHERGDVDLDAPMRTYLPHALVAGLHRLDGVDHTPKITVRHLLSHTSGLPDYLDDRPKGGRSWYRDLVAGTDRSWTLDDVVHLTRTALRPHFVPQDLTKARQKAHYADTNYQLLIAVIEAVAGQAFPAVLQQRLLAPLDLGHTWLPGRSEPLAATPAAPAALWSEQRPLAIPRALASCNDLISTADDTLAFLGALTSGAVFDDPGTYQLMSERWNRAMFPLRYGLGMMRYRIVWPFGPDRRPVTLVGHSGSTGTWLFHCPQLDLLLTGSVDEVSAQALPFRLLPKILQAYQG